MVKRRSKNILKSKNIRNKRSNIRRNRKRTNLKRKTRKYRMKISGGGKTIREIYDEFKKYNKAYGEVLTYKKNFMAGREGSEISEDVMQYLFEDILKNTENYPHSGDEVMTSRFNRADPSRNVTAPLYKIFGFDSVEEFDNNRERLRKEYEKEFNKYIPRVDVSKSVVYDYGILNQTTEKPTFLNYGRGYSPYREFTNEKGEPPPTVYKVKPSLRGFQWQNNELKVERDMTDTDPDLENLYKSHRVRNREHKEKNDQMTQKSIEKKMKYFAGGGK